jgi:cytochrome b pre-mRNA-processing protein 3
MRAAQERLAAADLDGILNRDDLFPAFSTPEVAHDA